MDKVLPGGIYKDLSLTGTSAGSFLTVPDGRIIEFLYGQLVIVTSATVGNRTYKVTVKNSAGLTILPLFKITIAASLEKYYVFGTSKPTNTEVEDAILLPSLLLNGAMKLDVTISGGVANDQWFFVGKYLEWIK